MPPIEAPASSATRRKRAGLALLTLPTVMVALDMNVLFLALPKLTADLEPSASQQLWISDAYGLMVGVLVLAAGALGDRVGRRRLLLIGCAGFAVASLAAAFAVSAEMLIVARIATGIAGAALMPSTLALITEMFPDQGERGAAIALWATCQFGGAALGPVFGGVLLRFWWWGSIFLIAIPVCLLVLLLGRVLLLETTTTSSSRLDGTSVLLWFAALVPFLYAVKSFAGGTRPAWLVITLLVVAVAAGLIFTRRQLTARDPYLDLALLREPVIRAVFCCLILAGVAMAGTGLVVTQYLQSVLGHSPLASSALFAPMGLGVAAGTMCTPLLLRRSAPRTLMATGLLVACLGSVLVTFASPERPVALLITGIAVLAFGTGPLFALGTQLVVSAVAPDRAGRAAGLSETSNYVGSTMGIAFLGAAAAAMFGTTLSHSAAVAGLPDGSRALAEQGIAAARDVATGLSSGPGADLLDAATQAYTGSLHLVGVVSAVTFLLGAVLLSRVPAGATVTGAGPS